MKKSERNSNDGYAIVFFLIGAFMLMLTTYVFYSFIYFGSNNDNINFIVIPSDSAIPREYGNIVKKGEAIFLTAQQPLYWNNVLYERIDLTKATVADTFRIDNYQYSFFLEEPQNSWKTIYDKDLHDLKNRGAGELIVGTDQSIPRTIVKLDKGKLSRFTSNDIALRIIPPAENETFPVYLGDKKLRITVTDSIYYLERRSEVKRLYPVRQLIVHSIQSGESLWSLSRRYGQSVDGILTLNNLPSNTVQVGQQIRVQVPEIYELRDNDIIHIGSPKEPLYSLRIRVNQLYPLTTVNPNNPDHDISVLSNSLRIQIIEQDAGAQMRRLFMTIYDNGKYLSRFAIDLSKKNVLINENKLATAIPIPFWRNIIPQRFVNYSSQQQLNRRLKLLQGELIDPLFQLKKFDYTNITIKGRRAIVDDHISLPVSRQVRSFMKSRDWSEFYDKSLRPVSRMLSTPGMAFFMETDSSAVARHIFSDESWRVYSEGDRGYKVGIAAREYEFTYNPGKFIYKPYLNQTDDQTLVFEKSFTFDSSKEVLRVLKICGFTDYHLELNGVLIQSELFNHTNRDYNLFEEDAVYNSFLRALRNSNVLRVHLTYNPQKIEPVFPQKVPLTYSLNNQEFVIDNDWQYSLDLGENVSALRRWSEGEWYGFNDRLDRLLGGGSDIFKATLYFRKRIYVDDQGAVLRVTSQHPEIYSYIDGQLFDQTTNLRQGSYWLGIEFRLKYLSLFSKNNQLYHLFNYGYIPPTPFSITDLGYDGSSAVITANNAIFTEYRIIRNGEVSQVSSLPGEVKYLLLNSGALKEKSPDLTEPFLAILAAYSGELKIYGNNLDSSFVAEHSISENTNLYVLDRLVGSIDRDRDFVFNGVQIILDKPAEHIAYDAQVAGRTVRKYSHQLDTKSLVGFKTSTRSLGLESSLQELKGNHLVELTIDGKLQRLAEEVLTGIIRKEREDDRRFFARNRGSADKQRSETALFLQHKKHYQGGVLIADSRGRILVAASYPFLRTTSQEQIDFAFYQKYFENSIGGLDNINWDGRFFPGSSFKVIDALAMYSASNLLHRSDERIRYINRIIAGYPHEAHPFNLSTPNYTSMLAEGNRPLIVRVRNHRNEVCRPGTKIEEAFARSFNTYFVYSMLHLYKGSVEHPDFHLIYNSPEIETATDIFPMRHFVDGLDMNGRVALVDFSVKDKDFYYSSIPSVVKDNAYEQYEVAQLSIGQNLVELTPLQQIRHLSLVSRTDGSFVDATLINSVRDLRSNKTLYNHRETSKKVKNVDNNTYRRTKNLMRQVVTFEEKRGERTYTGTGVRMKQIERNSNLKFYAKTGTADISRYRFMNHAWFIGFAEDEVSGETYYFVSVIPYTTNTSEVAVRTIYELFKRINE